MRSKKIIVATFTYGLLFLSILLIACASTPTTVVQEERISLQDGGPHSGNHLCLGMTTSHLAVESAHASTPAGTVQERSASAAIRAASSRTVSSVNCVDGV